MVDSTTPPSIEPIEAAPRRIAVACSGGRDSVALLHVTARMAAALNQELALQAEERCEAMIEVIALHVHHGLSPHADEWLARLRSWCLAWAEAGLPVRLTWRHVQLSLQSGDSVEAVARKARYAALKDMALSCGCDIVLLGHHQRDQAETFLLQALRGAGARGLAAMPSSAGRGGLIWTRPWLKHSRTLIDAYVAEHRLEHIDDDSNTDTRFARNRLRLNVWPALAQAFESAEGSLAQAAAHQADLKSCLDDWLQNKLPLVTSQLGEQLALDVVAWLAHSPGQQRELLRAWYKLAAQAALTREGALRLQDDLLRRAAQGIHGLRQGSARWQWQADRELVLYRGLLSARVLTDAVVFEGPVELSIKAPGRVVLPHGLGVLHVVSVEQGGVALASLETCWLASRAGGERFQMAPDRPARSLKKQFQLMGVPAWRRQGPLLYARDQLVFVPGLGLDARAWAGQGQAQVALSWQAVSGEDVRACTVTPDGAGARRG